MFDYLQQFNNLPKDLRDQVSSPSAMALIAELESKYQVDLAIVIMKLMVKSLKFSDLPTYLGSELLMSPETADQLMREMKAKLFASLADYLGLTSEIRALDIDKVIEALIKEAGLTLPSAVAISRFKNIASTYARGVRNKIDTRNTLAKDVKIGGLSLTPEEIDRVLKICDSYIAKGAFAAAPAAPSPAPVPATRLDKIIGAAEKTSPAVPEYDLKKALAKGETKPVAAALDTKHELPKPAAQLDLPQPEKAKEIPAPVVVPKPVAALKPEAPKPEAPKPAVAPAAAPKPAMPVQPKAVPVTPAPVAPKAAPLPPKAVPAAPVAPRAAISRQAPAPSSAKPQMHDIKPMPKVMGPVEELQFLDVVNFRRLGTTPAEMTAKVFSKIKLLEKDGYDKMVAGVRAWRQSPVNRLYLRLGQEAIAKGHPLKEAIEVRKAAKQEYLSMDEIEAIVSLNSKLVF